MECLKSHATQLSQAFCKSSPCKCKMGTLTVKRGILSLINQKKIYILLSSWVAKDHDNNLMRLIFQAARTTSVQQVSNAPMFWPSMHPREAVSLPAFLHLCEFSSCTLWILTIQNMCLFFFLRNFSSFINYINTNLAKFPCNI